jgi:2-succinyl-5-enolpyruvyl-6-hydroxy-3-cyclohexene-1-carboxylate synthase
MNTQRHPREAFPNVNALWAWTLAETLVREGLELTVICPGSRSAPLAFAFGRHERLEALPMLDERSAAFFALGAAKRSGKPVALVCTSGTAAANFLPAVIEARESRVPLLVLTADRPPEMRDCHSGQTIDQVKLYGSYPNWYAEVAVPEARPEMLAYLRQTIRHAWERCSWPFAGPVHLNLPFRDPLPPLPQAGFESPSIDWETFFAAPAGQAPKVEAIGPDEPPFADLPGTERGVIVAGPAQPADAEGYCRAVAKISQALGWPVLADALSPLRNYAALNPRLVTSYDALLRSPRLAQALAPERIISLGALPASKALRGWMESSGAMLCYADFAGRDLDALRGRSSHWRGGVEALARAVGSEAAPESDYALQWMNADRAAGGLVRKTVADGEVPFEGKGSLLLSRHLPEGTPLFVASSMPARDMDFFWEPGDRRIQPCFSRGANGIDGTLSTALGLAHRNRPTVLLTGDLALLHDTNGFLAAAELKGSLTIVVINNDGGGIFEMLPVAAFEPTFERYFATPQRVDFSKLSLAYGIEHRLIASWESFAEQIGTLPERGVRLLELRTDRKRDAAFRKRLFADAASAAASMLAGG